jgi:hypothetical protein
LRLIEQAEVILQGWKFSIFRDFAHLPAADLIDSGVLY